MSLYIFLFAILFGLATPIWFGYLFIPVRRLRKGADWLDATPVDVRLPEDKDYTVKNLRGHSSCGDKIVVPHMLKQWTKDLEGKIFTTLVYGSGITAALNVFVVIYNGSLQSRVVTLREMITAMKDNWPFPVFLAGVTIQIISYLMLVHDQARKYTSIINEAKPKTISFFTKAVRRFKKWSGI